MLAIVAMIFTIGIYDLRNREIDDRLFILFGIVTAGLYIFDHSIDLFDILMIVASIVTAIIGFVYKFLHTGDFLTIIIITFMLPVIGTFLPTGMMIMFSAIFTSMFILFILNITLNLSEYRKGTLFKGIKSSNKKKAVMFFLCHRHRKFEHHVTISQDDEGYLRLLKQKFIKAKKPTGYYVQISFPLITMMIPMAIFLGISMILIF